MPNNYWLNALVENLPLGVILMNDKMEVMYCNNQYCKLLGITELPSSIIGTAAEHIFPKVTLLENVIETEETIRIVINSGKKAKGQKLKLKNDRIITYDYVPVDFDGFHTGHLFTLLDETERFKAKEIATEQRLFFENILNAVPADLAVFSPEKKYIFVNPMSVKNAAIREWIIGKTDLEYAKYRNKSIALAEERMKTLGEVVVTKKMREREEIINGENGKLEYYIRRLTPIFDEHNNHLMTIGWGINVTDNQARNRQIAKSEKRYKDLFNYSQGIIASHDLNGYFIDVNPALCNILGYSVNEIVGRHMSSFLPEDDVNLFDAIYLQNIISDKKSKGIFRVVSKEKKHLYLLYQNYLVENTDENPYVISFAQDVTDRIKIEKKLKEANKQTEENAKLKDRFLANMSHEIRTPMNGIMGITKLLQKTSLTTEQENFLNVIQVSANNLMNIINDILDLEKLAIGKVEIEKIPFNLYNYLHNCIQLLQVTANEKELPLVFEYDGDKETLLIGDPSRLTQILNNLVSNAIKFTQKGSVTAKFEISTPVNNKVLLKVSIIDTGIGIDDNKLIKIFQPFTQAYPDTARKYGGTGLGLAITKNLVELQDGQIWVESALRRGSTFHVSIPYEIITTPSTAMKNTKQGVINELGKISVLLAEDNEINQLLATRILNLWGFEVQVANNGIEALALLNNNSFQVILMDIQMPDMNGLEATTAIRNLPDDSKRNIPIIALTANALPGEEKQYFEVGMNDYLIKPFQEQELYNAIKKAIEIKF